MWIRKNLPIVLAVLALLTSSAAFAAEAPALAVSEDQFLATLQTQPGDAGEEMPDLEGVQTPILKHGTDCYISGFACRACTLSNGSRGYNSCDTQRCFYNGSWHTHYINCLGCAISCAS
jgi:hypothetical protein